MLLKKAYEFFPKEIGEKYYEPAVRKRPRRAGNHYDWTNISLKDLAGFVSEELRKRGIVQRKPYGFFINHKRLFPVRKEHLDIDLHH